MNTFEQIGRSVAWEDVFKTGWWRQTNGPLRSADSDEHGGVGRVCRQP
jgi:hypothetical protein